jgi:hypothetical protein
MGKRKNEKKRNNGAKSLSKIRQEGVKSEPPATSS